MQLHLTPGAQRALHEAATWSGGEEASAVEASALLLGLLSERECRAALKLDEHAIDAPAVRKRWPNLTAAKGVPVPTNDAVVDVPLLSADVRASLAAVSERLEDFPQPLTLATEHLLLALVAADHELAGWLRERGLDADRLEQEIRDHYHLAKGPLPFDDGCGSDWQSDLHEAPLPLEVEPIAGPILPSDPTRPSQIAPQDQVRLLRVLDAAENRCREGVRVVEDYVRFVLDDRHLTDHLKQLRHDLTAAFQSIPPGHRLASRETQSDVGTTLSTPSEVHREDIASVLAANFARVQEALRSLEEFGKVLDPALAGQVKGLRYRVYTLQRAVEVTRHGVQRLESARLYVLLDGGASAEAFRRTVETLVGSGVDVLQLRDKRLDDRRLLQRARLLRQATQGSRTLMIVNDRPDLTALSRADGVHLGQDELTVKDARTVVGPEALVGVSTHSIQQARRAVLDGANYLGVGPTFPSGTKEFHDFPGLDLLRSVAAEIRLPAFAIGGIDRANLPEVLSTGIRRIAVSGAVTSADDPSAAAGELRGMLEGR